MAIPRGGGFDVAVVGGGPAGSVAALALASRGARVVVLERRFLPRYKTCGGGLVARALAALPSGVDLPAERDCHAAEIGLLDVGRRFEVRRPHSIVTMTMRADLDLALLRAAEAAGAEVRAGCAFESLEPRRDGIAVRTSRGSLRSSFVIGADGALGRVAPAAGWKDPPGLLPALEAEVRVEPATLARFSRGARFDFPAALRGYAWIFPKREHLSIGVLSVRRGAALKRALAGYLEAAGVRGIREVDLHGSLVPVRPRPGGFARGRVLLAGDAAGLADPLTAEGITNAIRSGRLAAEAITDAGLDPEAARRSYEVWLAREVLPDLRVGRALAGLLYRPRVRRALFRRWGQGLAEAVTEVVTGRHSYGALLARPANWLRLVTEATR